MWHEAQAIVLAAGPGSRLTSVGIRPKCLLPVGNFPLIYYSLKFLQENGFKVIVNQESEGEIKKMPEVYDLKLRLDLAVVDTSEDPGTAESLKTIEHKIRRDAHEIVIISSDLITSANFSEMMHQHMSLGAALTILTAPQLPEFLKAKPPGPKSKTNLGSDLLGVEAESNRLVYAVSEGDYDDVIDLRNMLSYSDDGIEIQADALDCHLYIMKKWLVDYILNKESPCLEMGSLKAEVIPHVISNQSEDEQRKACRENEIGIHKFIKKGKFDDLIRTYNISSIKSRFQKDADPDGFECYIFCPHDEFSARINTLGNLWQINRKICDESTIGRSTQISEKTNITNSVLGNHCRIGSFVRISNSLLFDYVQVESGCVIENSIICVNVEKKCVIKNCILTDVSKIMENKKI
ncbi:Translation initiation factor eIF-2B subunit gamma [Armadillidium vulgare]|nr:Translation initiation factor eIF-2B subunit gamma [Armadillidium vulgare]